MEYGETSGRGKIWWPLTEKQLTETTTQKPSRTAVCASCRLLAQGYRGPNVLRVILLLLAALSRSRYDFYLPKGWEEESGVGKSDGHAALQIIITVLAWLDYSWSGCFLNNRFHRLEEEYRTKAPRTSIHISQNTSKCNLNDKWYVASSLQSSFDSVNTRGTREGRFCRVLFKVSGASVFY